MYKLKYIMRNIIICLTDGVKLNNFKTKYFYYVHIDPITKHIIPTKIYSVHFLL